MKAVWNDVIIAESENTVVIENNHYFPPDSINKKHFINNEHHTFCPWKGEASYFDLKVKNKTNESAAWYYSKPKEAAKVIQNYVAFWNGVKVVE